MLVHEGSTGTASIVTVIQHINIMVGLYFAFQDTMGAGNLGLLEECRHVLITKASHGIRTLAERITVETVIRGKAQSIA